MTTAGAWNSLDFALIWTYLVICTVHAVVSDIPLLLLNQPVEWVCNNLWQEREGNHWIMENISVLQNTSMLATFYTHAHFLAVNCIASFLAQWWRKYNHKTYNLTMQAHTILLFLSVDLYSLILLVYWWSVQLRDISMHVLNSYFLFIKAKLPWVVKEDQPHT